MTTITVIIPNYKGIKFIENCLSSLYAQVEGTPSYEVLVVDNASEDGSVELIREKFPQTRLLCLKENTGFCHAVNMGIQSSDSPFVLLLNNDTKVYPDFIKQIYAPMEDLGVSKTSNAKGKGKASGRMISGGKDGRWPIFSVSAAMLMWDKPELMDDAGDVYTIMGWAFTRGKGKPYADYQRRVRIFSACGGAALYRRDILEKIGLFDEKHFAYLEDLDLGYRANIYGYRSLYEPRARVVHYGSASTGSRYNAWKTKRAAANSVYVIAKNLPLFFKVLHFPFLLAGYGIKFLFFVRKKMGRQYLLGVCEGLRLSMSYEGRQKRVKFQTKHLGNYLRIEWDLIAGLFRR